jgi:hypothetical protein
MKGAAAFKPRPRHFPSYPLQSFIRVVEAYTEGDEQPGSRIKVAGLNNILLEY